MERRPARRDADMAKPARRRERPKERWLLTRKTWKYMSDAGRRLIPDGAQNRPEDIPKIEAYFQEVCQREPRFLLWRKSSYPGAIPKPRRKKRIRGGSVRERSPSDDIIIPTRPTELMLGHTSGGRFDMAKMRRDFFTAPSGSATSFGSRVTPTIPTPVPAEDEDESTLVDLLRKYLKLEEDSGSSKIAGNDELVRTLRRYLKKQSERTPVDSDANPSQRTLLENLSRYYCRSPNRDSIVQDLLTDRNLLKRLYHDLRKTRPYRGSRGGGSGYYPSGPSTYISGLGRSTLRRTDFIRRVTDDGDELRSPPTSPPPLIEVSHESLEDRYVDCGTQTSPIAEEVLLELERTYREKLEARTAPTSPTSPPPGVKPARRRSSVDHDDVSQSVSDTIKRYLRMARKKSVDADKADRFKRINYDKNLRNIKPKSVIDGDVDDDGPHKGCQTEEGWILTYRELRFASVASSPTSPPPSPVSPPPQGFLSSLLGRTPSPGGPGGGRSSPTTAPSAGGMQKSRSSSSVVSSVSKRLWRTRSRSSSRVSCASWTPQGSCCWADAAGRCVRLPDTSLLTLSEVERRALQQAALARLQQLNLGTTLRIPEDNASVPATKPKRRAYLLKRKAITTGFFDQKPGKDGEKDKDSPAGGIFGVPLAQCVETERALRRLQQVGGSRVSLASLSALDKAEDNESCDSAEWGGSALEEAGGGGPRVPALVSACLAHLRRHGLRTLGLFRVSASKKRVRQLREEWERGQEAALDAAVCPHDVATLLKEFLRDLPDPLLCRDLYPAFISTQKIRNRRLQWEALKLIVQLLPAAHRDTLNALLSFLAELASHSEDDREPGNKMDAANLATVFAPNILHKNKPNESVSSEQLSERADVINVVRQLVERQAELWTLPAELLHEAYIHLAHTAPHHLDALLPRRAECAAQEAAASADGAARRVWSRETFLHGASVTVHGEGPGHPAGLGHIREGPSHVRRRARDAVSDTSSGSLSSAMTIVTSRVRSSEECASSGVVCSPPAVRDSNDSNDSASDYNETLGGSDEDSCVITASLHIPAPFPQTITARTQVTAPSRRRSTSGSESSAKRDSAVGSSSASNASSPPTSPPPAPLKVTMTSAGDIRRPADIDRLINLGRERNTSDARAVVLRQHDESVKRSTSNTRISSHHTNRHDLAARNELRPARSDQNSGRNELRSAKIDQNSGRNELRSAKIDQNSGRNELRSAKIDQNSGRNELRSAKIDQNSGRNELRSARSDQNSGRMNQNSSRIDQNSGRVDQSRKEEKRKEEQQPLRKEGSSTMLYKRGELISSARSHHSHPT